MSDATGRNQTWAGIRIETVWTVTKDGRLSRCDLWPHPLGTEIRLSTDDREHFVHVHWDREEALAYAEELRTLLVAKGWLATAASAGSGTQGDAAEGADGGATSPDSVR